MPIRRTAAYAAPGDADTGPDDDAHPYDDHRHTPVPSASATRRWPVADTILPPSTDPAAASLTVEPHRFAIVPEWVLDAPVSDAAVRLYAVLARYGGTSGRRMPSRSTLAARLGKRSVDTVDRALRELEQLGAVEVERRSEGGQKLTNRYHLRTSQPRNDGDTTMIGAAATADARGPLAPLGTAAVDVHGPVDEVHGGSRIPAATPPPDGQVVSGSPRSGSRIPAATRRTDAARVAAPMRHDPEVFTQRTTTSSPPSPDSGTPPRPREVVEEAVTGPAPLEHPIRDIAGIDDLDALSAQIAELRRSLGKPTGRWTAHCLHAAIALTVQRGWPTDQVQRALVTVASDPTTVSPMRLAEAGPWWDEPIPAVAAPC